MKYSILILFVVLITSCSTKQVNLTTEHFDKNSNLEGYDSQKLAETYTRDGSLGVAGYYVKAYPISEKYVDLLKKENLPLVGMESLDPNKSCFFVSLHTKVDKEDHVLFQDWPSKIIDFNKEEHLLTWTKSTLEKHPHSKIIPSYHGPKEEWFNKGIGCTDKKIDFSKSFSMVLEPQGVTWLLRYRITLFWEIGQYEMIDGKKMIKEDPDKKKRTQPYRGW